LLNKGNRWSLSLAYESVQVQEEEGLVKEAVCGDQQAFARLYEAHFNKIYRYVYLKIGDQIEAEDMTQQVFLHALKSISSFRYKGSPFTAWLFRIAHNQIVDYLRRKTTRPVSVELDETVPASTKDPERMTELTLNVEQLQRATKHLTSAQQEVLSMRFAGGLSIEETAKAMGKSTGAIKALQHAAVLSLRKILVVEEDGAVKTN
jgi:RNA polymerase sigma-70 factor (ECF subfamily)